MNVLRWTPELDALIPAALETARSRMRKSQRDRETVLVSACRILIGVAPELRHVLTKDLLDAHISELNVGRARNDPSFIYVLPPAWHNANGNNLAASEAGGARTGVLCEKPS